MININDIKDLEEAKEDIKEVPKKTNIRKTTKKSIFNIIPQEDLEEYGKRIMLKQISYNGLLKKLQEYYIELIDIKTSNSLRYFMITKGFVLNEKSFDSINKNIEKTKLAQRKQKSIIKKLKKNLFEDEDFLEVFFKNEQVKNHIKNILKEMLVKKDN